MPPIKPSDQQQSTPSSNAAPIRTFQSDLAELVQREHASVADVLAAQERRRQAAGEATETEKQEVMAKRRKLAIMLAAGGGFITLGLLILVGVLLFRPDGGILAEPPPARPSLISFEEQGTLDTAGQNRAAVLERIVAERRNATLSLGRVREIVFTDGTSPIDAGTLLARIAPNLPPAFIRALSPDYFFGITQTGYRDAFLIMESVSFHTGFASLLDWEPYMVDDVGQALARLDSPAFFDAQKKGAPVPKKFSDELFMSRDTRVLRNERGDVSLIYTIVDRTTFVIAGSELALKEALDRLAARRSVR